MLGWLENWSGGGLRQGYNDLSVSCHSAQSSMPYRVVNEYVLFAILPLASVTVIVAVVAPGSPSGVPDITPVDASIDKP